ncbi:MULTISPECIES: lipase family protein [unclassified Phenylobacterium]|uniref:lipase family protein n=1 Tax=unclassified Phenylobacterium TaxID=2640670 RepID=UPI000A5B2948|nr:MULTISPECIES: lipase family protein [unclassified Phenylobacterium]
MRPSRILAALTAAPALLALVAGGVLPPTSARAGELPTGPAAGDMDISPFYRWDGPLPGQAGQVLRRAPMPEQPEMTAAGEALRLLYASTDARWGSGPIPVSGVLFLPAGKPPQGGWPLVAWAHGTLGVADVCAPSWTGFRARDAAYMNRWLKAGFAVVATDYQGLGGPGPHPYLHWPSEGRSVLDAARAAFAEKAGLLSNHVLIVGQSQGAGAALGAARLSRTYAPELNVLGAVATGVNSTFPDGPVPLPPRNSANMFLSVVAGGLRDDGPPVEAILSPRGAQLLAAARQGCTAEIGALSRELGIGGLSDAFSISLDELAALRLPVTDMPSQAVGVPLMIGTGLSDATIPPMRQYAAAAALCAAGDQVIWRRYEGLGHDGALHGSFEDALAFARARLRGESPGPACQDLSPPGAPGTLDPKAPFNKD